MRRLIYVSRARIQFDADALEALINSSAAHNAARGVTGMLWFDGANFAQVLEGDDEAVAASMQRIFDDDRHNDIVIVLDREVRHRAFGDWQMAQSNDTVAGVESSAFLVGTAISQPGSAARRLREIVLATEQS